MKLPLPIRPSTALASHVWTIATISSLACGGEVITVSADATNTSSSSHSVSSGLDASVTTQTSSSQNAQSSSTSSISYTATTTTTGTEMTTATSSSSTTTLTTITTTYNPYTSLTAYSQSPLASGNTNGCLEKWAVTPSLYYPVGTVWVIFAQDGFSCVCGSDYDWHVPEGASEAISCSVN